MFKAPASPVPPAEAHLDGRQRDDDGEQRYDHNLHG